MKIFEIRQATNPMIRKLIAAAMKSPIPSFTEPTLQVAFCHSPPGPTATTIGMDEVVDDRFHQRVEGGADDDRYRQCNDILLQQKVLELLDHGHRALRLKGFRLRETN